MTSSTASSAVSESKARLIELIKKLVRIPSVTGSPEEVLAAGFIFEQLSQLDCFKKNPGWLVKIPTPLEGDGRALFTVAACIMAEKPTPKTVVFIGHYDVVDASAYGEMRQAAFDHDKLAEKFANEFIDEGELIFGRGSMDMKCGVALEMELLRDYDANRGLFDVNVIALFVPDEENSGCGMRGAAEYLAELKAELGLAYIACIDTEPSEPGMPGAEKQLIFLGSLGKLLPAFYCRGAEAHIGNYYKGLSAALLSTHIVQIAEANPGLADPLRSVCYPSWVCLKHRTLEESYSVTVPNRSIAYFNCLVTTKTPSQVMTEMTEIAEEAATRIVRDMCESHAKLSSLGYKPGIQKLEVRVLSFADIFEMAALLFEGGIEALLRYTEDFIMNCTSGDSRDRGVALVERLTEIARIEPPFIATGFLPPYNPPRTSALVPHVVRAMDRVIEEAKSNFGVDMEKIEFFSGISDMSFTGFAGTDADVETYRTNCPCWGTLFTVPFEAMQEIDIPVVNIGPAGHDAHKRTERLETRYSLDVLPHLLVSAVRALSEEWDAEH